MFNSVLLCFNGNLFFAEGKNPFCKFVLKRKAPLKNKRDFFPVLPGTKPTVCIYEKNYAY